LIITETEGTMPAFLWEATSRKGEQKKGELDAADEATVRAQLRRQGFKNISVKAKPKDLMEYLPFLQQSVKEKDVVVFSRIFSTMINAGLPLIQCLELLASQEQNKTFAGIIRAIKEDIEGGSTLTDALKKYPKIFDELFVNLVAAGEAGGILDVILSRLSAYMEKAMKLKSKVKGAMTYPASVLVISIGVVAVLLLKVIPVFQKMFEGMGGTLPAPTQFLVNASQFAQNYFYVFIIVIVAVVFAYKRFVATEKGRYVVDSLALKAPVFGQLIRKVAVSKFTRTMSTMMSSGVPILEALNIVSKTAGNVIIENALIQTRKSISEGRTIAEPLMETDIFPPMVVQMIAVGEATGALDTMLAKIADFYDDEVDAAVDALTSLLEPFMMVFLGGVVGGMIIAMYLPIFQMASVVGG
jgi:type IV pilus assembly protein PilC